ncbi:MAG: DUF169 domain-containing protein [Candidatus Baldrarchaeia archaeon]
MGESKISWREKSIDLETLLRLRTPPVAVKLLEDENFPPGTIRPSQMGIEITICQAITAARHMFQTIGMSADDNACPPSMFPFGWAEIEDSNALIEFFKKAGHGASDDAIVEIISKLPTLEPGKYPALLIAPLRRCTFQPDVIMIFGNAAQVGRLIFARTYLGGGALKAEMISRAASCAEGIIRPFKSRDCAVTIPGGGDRVFASIDDDELIFSFHVEWLDRIIEGLKNAGRGIGLRYPMPRFMMYKPVFPQEFQKLRSKMKIIKRK